MDSGVEQVEFLLEGGIVVRGRITSGQAENLFYAMINDTKGRDITSES